jgi:hypothetical protein
VRNALVAGLCCLGITISPPAAFSQDRNESPAAQKKQPARMKSCSGKAHDKKLMGRQREQFVTACLKGR